MSRKSAKTQIRFTRKVYPLIKLLYEIGCIRHFVVTKRSVKNTVYYFITFSTVFYRNTLFFKDVTLISTPSKRHTISLKALRTVNTHLKASVLIISTPYGLVTHMDALKLNTGGLLVAIIN